MKDHVVRQDMLLEHNTVPREEFEVLAQYRKEAMSKDFINAWNEYARYVYENAKNHGWWDTPRNDAEMMMLMVSEIAEACEGDRVGNPPDDKIPEFKSIETELADCVIRIMDYCHQRGFNLAEALVAKAKYNESRPFKHGGKKY